MTCLKYSDNNNYCLTLGFMCWYYRACTIWFSTIRYELYNIDIRWYYWKPKKLKRKKEECLRKKKENERTVTCSPIVSKPESWTWIFSSSSISYRELSSLANSEIRIWKACYIGWSIGNGKLIKAEFWLG